MRDFALRRQSWTPFVTIEQLGRSTETANKPEHTTGNSCAEGLAGHILGTRFKIRESWFCQGAAVMVVSRAFVTKAGELTSLLIEKTQKLAVASIQELSANFREYR